MHSSKLIKKSGKSLRVARFSAVSEKELNQFNQVFPDLYKGLDHTFIKRAKKFIPSILFHLYRKKTTYEYFIKHPEIPLVGKSVSPFELVPFGKARYQKDSWINNLYGESNYWLQVMEEFDLTYDFTTKVIEHLEALNIVTVVKGSVWKLRPIQNDDDYHDCVFNKQPILEHEKGHGLKTPVERKETEISINPIESWKILEKNSIETGFRLIYLKYFFSRNKKNFIKPKLDAIIRFEDESEQKAPEDLYKEVQEANLHIRNFIYKNSNSKILRVVGYNYFKLQRIFLNNTELGGRYYSRFNGTQKSLRNKIALCFGYDTEIDLKSFNINMAYFVNTGSYYKENKEDVYLNILKSALKKHMIYKSAYKVSVENEKNLLHLIETNIEDPSVKLYRKLIKTISLAFIGAKSPLTTKRAIYHKIETSGLLSFTPVRKLKILLKKTPDHLKEKVTKDFYEKENRRKERLFTIFTKDYSDVINIRFNPEILYDAFKDEVKEIERSLEVGKSLYFQKLESEIACSLIKKCINNHICPMIIHDAIIVPHKWASGFEIKQKNVFETIGKREFKKINGRLIGFLKNVQSIDQIKEAVVKNSSLKNMMKNLLNIETDLKNILISRLNISVEPKNSFRSSNKTVQTNREHNNTPKYKRIKVNSFLKDFFLILRKPVGGLINRSLGP